MENDPAVDAWFKRHAENLARSRMFGFRACASAAMTSASYCFFLGAHLEDPADLLEGSGKNMRHLKLRPATEIDSDALAAMIEVAYLRVESEALR